MTPISRSDFRLNLPHDASGRPRPTVLPHPDVPDELKWVAEQVLTTALVIAPTLGYSLLRSAYHLAEASAQAAEGYSEGKSVSHRCVACATGAIAVACAGVEAVMNEILLFSRELPIEPAKQVLLSRARGFGLQDRLTAIAALAEQSPAEQSPDWGAEPFQSYDLLLTLRNVLSHHEPKWVFAAEGYWPAAKLRDLVLRVRSPYADIEALDWSVHLLTPNGASWAVDVAFRIANTLEDYYNSFNPKGPGIL